MSEEKQEEKKNGNGTIVALVAIFVIFGVAAGYFIGTSQSDRITTLEQNQAKMDAKIDKLLGYFDQVSGGGGTNPVEVSADDDAFLGPENAENVVIIFSDYECPYCGAFEGTNTELINQFRTQDSTYEPAMPYLKGLAESGKIKLVFRDFPLDFHQQAFQAAMASECAHEQNKFWEMHQKLFEGQGDLKKENYLLWAEELDLDVPKFKLCIENREYEDEINKDITDGSASGVSGTPTTFVNGVPVIGAVPAESFKGLLE